MAKRLRLGIDIGGTFTDLSLMDAETGLVRGFKTPSVPSDPAVAVWNGVRALFQQEGIDPGDVEHFIHGTTLGVNTLIQRNGTRTGLLVTQGFRDILLLGRLRLPNPNDYLGDKPVPLVPRPWVVEIDERLNARGQEVRPLDLSEVERAVAGLRRDGVEAVAVAFLHSYRNPDHEIGALEHIRSRFPDMYACASFEIWPQQREYERALVTVINAYLGKRLETYFTHLRERMDDLGLRATLLTTQSNGGVMSVANAVQTPIATLLSGPASGVVGALRTARSSGFEKVIALDMGGTSADVSVIDGDVSYSTENTVDDLPVIMPAVDVSSIGAGGGSVAWCDSSGVLKVGPESAGADPGPACYGRGGERPTVTDAYVTLGILDPARFLGGTQVLDRALAERAVAGIGEVLGLPPAQAAEAILRVTTSNMYAQFVPLMTRKGVDPSDFALLAYGGAGPTHAFLIAREVGIKRVIVPPSPGTLCAFGALVADIRHDFVRTLQAELAGAATEVLDGLRELRERAGHWIADERVEVESVEYLYSADVRYHGQSFELTIEFPESALAEGIAALAAAFHRRHEEAYGHADRSAPVEVTNLRLTVIGRTIKPQTQAASSPSSAQVQTHGVVNRPIFFEGSYVQATVRQRDGLAPGEAFPGPAIIEQYDSTTFVPPGFNVRVDDAGNLIGEADAHGSR